MRQGPPDLDEVLKQLWSRCVKWAPEMPQGYGRHRLVLAVCVMIYGLSGFYVLAPAEQAVVTRFGAYAKTSLAGVHWRLPGVEQVFRVNVERVHQLNYHAEMLTQDENYVDMDVAVMYRIVGARAYLFASTDPDESVYQVTGSASRQAAGNHTLEKIITSGRSVVRQEIEQQLRSILDRYQIGIEILDVKLQEAKPPQEVQEAFDDAIKAREDEQRFINKAMAYRSAIVPKAKGRAYVLLSEAEIYRNRVVQEAKSEAALFLAALPAYLAAPKTQAIRLRAQALESILASQPKLVLSGKTLPLLSLTEWLNQQKSAVTPKESS